eukprot:s253_g20.t1
MQTASLRKVVTNGDFQIYCEIQLNWDDELFTTRVEGSLVQYMVSYFGGVRISLDPHMRPVMDVTGKFEGWPSHATFHSPAWPCSTAWWRPGTPLNRVGIWRSNSGECEVWL